MPRHRREVAETVARTLFDSEVAIDSALATTAAFLGRMPQARQEARVAARVGQAAIDHATQALAALAEARRQIIAAHEALAEVQGQVGLGAFNFGGLIDKPPYPEKKFARLAPVPAQAA